MAFIRLDVTDFRNLRTVKLEPVAQGINLFFGQNGTGKTSLLEAIYYLSVGRSFRGTKIDRIIHHDAEKLSLFAQVFLSSQQKIAVGLERDQGGDLKIRIAGKDSQSISELASLTPVLLINSYCHHLLDSGPLFRRKYLDWGAFYYKNDFLRLWKQYQRALKQRNAALRARVATKELESWSKELIEAAAALDYFRKEYVEQLLPILFSVLTELLAIPNIKVSYSSGWSSELAYSDALKQSLEKDLQFGYTQLGPHRADLRITIDGVQAKDILSRGQQKLFVCAMMVAQGALLNQCVNKSPIYLIDDLPSELDEVSRSNLMSVLARQRAQIFITAIERNILEDYLVQSTAKVFHVEHGEITEMTLIANPKNVAIVE